MYNVLFRKRNNPHFYPGVLESLRPLRSVSVVIGTLAHRNANPQDIDGLRDLVDFCVSSVGVGVGKPDRRMFAACETKSKCEPGNIVMVGDNIDKDILGARKAGWRRIWVTPPAELIVI